MSDVLICNQGDLKRDCRQGIPRNICFFLEIIKKEDLSLLEDAGSMAKAHIGLMRQALKD